MIFKDCLKIIKKKKISIPYTCIILQYIINLTVKLITNLF